MALTLPKNTACLDVPATRIMGYQLTNTSIITIKIPLDALLRRLFELGGVEL
jgi:hypothetical protein